MDEPTTRVVAGAGATVLRYGSVIAVVVADRSALLGPVCDVARRVGLAGGPLAGSTAAAELVAAFTAAGSGLRAAALVLTPSGAEVVLSGDLPLRARTLVGELHLNGRSASEPVRQPLVGSYTRVSIGAVDEDAELAAAAPDAWSDLVAGAVPGNGVVVVLDRLVSHEPVSTPSVLPAEGSSAESGPGPITDHLEIVVPGPQPAASVDVHDAAVRESAGPSPLPVPFESLSFVGAAAPGDAAEPGRRPLPVETPGKRPNAEEAGSEDEIVEGLRCGRGHFNHPHAANCVWCGLGMVQVSHVLVRGVRPPLGVLVIDGQATFTLDADYVVGRQPRQDPEVDGDRVRELVLADPDRAISRVHAAVRLREWDVVVEDRGSGNGTWVVAGDGLSPAVRVLPDQPQVLAPGDHVRIGPHRLTFHSHHLR